MKLNESLKSIIEQPTATMFAQGGLRRAQVWADEAAEAVPAMEVSNPEVLRTLTDMLSFVSKAMKRVEAHRKEQVAPLQVQVRAVNDWAKQLVRPFEKVSNLIRAKLADHAKAEEQRRLAEEEERRRKLLEEQREKDREQGVRGPALPELPPEEVKKTVTGEMGAATAVKRWTYSVTDESQIPREYLQIDSGKVRQAIREGKREIPGLNIFQEIGVQAR